VPGASQAGAWPTKHSLLTTNYEPKSPSRRASDQSDEKSSLFEVPICNVRLALAQFTRLTMSIALALRCEVPHRIVRRRHFDAP
jgi:hypothetical protein